MSQHAGAVLLPVFFVKFVLCPVFPQGVGVVGVDELFILCSRRESVWSVLTGRVCCVVAENLCGRY